MPMIRHDYVHNQKFLDYVDKYARQHGITADEALGHELVRQVFLMYTDV